jgi:hypothetical protein
MKYVLEHRAIVNGHPTELTSAHPIRKTWSLWWTARKMTRAMRERVEGEVYMERFRFGYEITGGQDQVHLTKLRYSKYKEG